MNEHVLTTIFRAVRSLNWESITGGATEQRLKAAAEIINRRGVANYRLTQTEEKIERGELIGGGTCREPGKKTRTSYYIYLTTEGA